MKASIETDCSVVTFSLSSTTSSPKAYVTIRNTGESPLAFKVKTTEPKRYLVKPNQDVLSPNQSLQVQIILQQKELESILNNRAEQQDLKDRFLFACVPIEQEFFDKVSNKAGDPNVAKLLQDMWKKKTKEEIVNRKVECQFQYPETTTTTTTKKTENKTSPASIPTNPTPTSNPNPNPNPPPSASTSSSSSSVQEDWQAKYHEILTLLMQVTDERDRYKTSLKEVSNELHQLRESRMDSLFKDDVVVVGKNLPMNMNNNNNNNNNNSSNNNNNNSLGDVVVVSNSNSSSMGSIVGGGSILPKQEHSFFLGGTYNLWELVLVAIVSFLIARLIS